MSLGGFQMQRPSNPVASWRATTTPFSDRKFFQFCLFTLYLVGFITFALTWFIPAPYGRHSLSGCGPRLSPKLRGLLYSPALFFIILLYPFGQHATNPKALFLVSLYFLYYFNRVCTYHYYFYLKRVPAQGVPIGFGVIQIGIILLITYIQVREVSHYKEYDNDPAFGWRMLGGLFLFLWGLQINVWADRILIGLKGEDGEYKIPNGGWFELVSCPNYFGELVVWLGWAVMIGSFVGFGLFFFTFAYAVPRALAHHTWYLEKFSDYPKERAAIFPFL